MADIDRRDASQDKSQPKSSRDLPGQPPRKDTERDMEAAVIKDGDKTDVADRDRVHGDGTSVGLK